MTDRTNYFQRIPILFLLLMILNQIQAQWVYSQGLAAQTDLPELQRIHLTSYDFVRLNGMVDMGDIAFHPDGTLYGVIFDKIYALDTLTSNSTEVFDLGDFQAVGMTIDYNGLMYFGGSDPNTNRFGIAIFNPQNSSTRIVADFGPINSGFVNDLEFFNGELYIAGQLPPGYPEPAVLYRVDTTGLDNHDMITTYTMWPGRALAAISDSCGSQFLVSPASGILNFFMPPLDSVRQVEIIPGDGLFYSAGATSLTAYLGSIPPLRIVNIDIHYEPCVKNAVVTIEIRQGRQPAVEYSLDGNAYQSSAVFTNIPPGTYQAFVRDDWGCSQMSDPFEVMNIVASVTLVTTPASCEEDNATIIVNSTDPTLAYALDDTNFSFNMVFQGLSGGSHTLYILYDNGCMDSLQVQLDIVPTPEFKISIQPEQCNVGNGLIEVIDLAGITPYLYSLDGLVWQDEGVFDNMTAGTYTVFVTDTFACIVQNTVIVSVTGQPAINDILISPAHCGMADGAIEVIATSDHSTLEFALNGGLYSSNTTFLGLSAGTYLLSVSDTFDCTVEQEIVVNSIEGPVITDVEISPEHCGMADGMIVINAISNNGKLKYAIDGGALSDSTKFQGLVAGIHQIVVQDTNSCITQVDVTITESPAVKIQSLVSEDATCSMDNGSILVIVSDPIEINGYALHGINYQGSPMFSQLDSGNYTVYLRSHGICLDSASTIIERIEPPVIEDILVTSPRCDEDFGSVYILANRGFGVLSYSLNGGTSFDSNSVFVGLPSGKYLLTVMDMAGCIVTEMFSISPEGSPIINHIESMPSDCGKSSGTIEISAEGENLIFTLDDIFTNEDGVFSDLSKGVHHLAIIDDHGCMVDTTVNTPSLDCNVFVPSIFSPNGDGLNDNFQPQFNDNDGEIYIFEIYDRWGHAVFSCSGSNTCSWDGMISAKPAPTGVYVWRLVYISSADAQKEKTGDVTVLR